MLRPPRYTEKDVREAIARARNATEALRLLGLRAAGGNHQTLKKLIERYGIPVAHFDRYAARRMDGRRRAIPLSEVLVEGSNYNRGLLKQRLYDEDLKIRLCELCGQGEQWHRRQMSLILDHINGVATDNRLENLRIICPNCAATLDTHCGRKNRIDVEPRACVRCGSKFSPRYATQRYCSQACGVRHDNRRWAYPSLRKVPRPSYEQLMADVASMSMLAIGRKYGVSDSAVRKWIRWYEREREEEERAEAA